MDESVYILIRHKVKENHYVGEWHRLNRSYIIVFVVRHKKIVKITLIHFCQPIVDWDNIITMAITYILSCQ